MATFTGILSSTASDGIDFNEVEELLGFESGALLDITFESSVTTSGKYIPQTNTSPAEYEEISDTEIIAIYFNFESGEVAANQEQLVLMEQFKPENDGEIYWDLVQRNY